METSDRIEFACFLTERVEPNGPILLGWLRHVGRLGWLLVNGLAVNWGCGLGLLVLAVVGPEVGVLGLSLESHVGDKARVPLHLVGDDLGAAVGQDDGVLPVGVVPVPALVLVEADVLVVGVLAVHVVGVFVSRVGVGVGGGVAVVGQGQGQEGDEDEGLEHGGGG